MISGSTSRNRVRLLTVALLFCLCGLAVGARDAPADQRLGWSVAGGGWSAYQNVSTSPDTDSEAPALVIAESRAVHLVWEENDELFHSYQSHQTWSSPKRIRGTGNGEQPALAAGSGGTVHLVYVNDSDVFYVAWDGSAWTIPQPVSQTEQVSESPTIAVSGDGVIHVVASETAAKRLYHGFRSGSSSWTYVPITHEYGFAYGEGASIGVSPTNTVWLAFRDEDQEIYAMGYSGTAWSAPALVSDSTETPSTAPDLAIDGTGSPHVVWQEEIDGVWQVRYARGDNWSPPTTLSNSATGARLPAVATEGQEQVHVAWQDESFPFAIRLTSRAGSENEWLQPSAVYSGTRALQDVAISSGRLDGLHASWVEGSIGEILYAARRSHSIFLPLISSSSSD